MTSFLQMLCGEMAVNKVCSRICTKHINTALRRAGSLMQRRLVMENTVKKLPQHFFSL